ncbi:hypothetical protein KJ765_06050 [Candidatus Micrarchaeota archaeon]|nr:hypothetical protein [Candidatus Micrarchaeota archaeon]
MEIPVQVTEALEEKPEEKKRTGKTREHYNKQKSQAYSYFRIRSEDAEKMQNAQFTIFDFITNSFAFSQTKKELTVHVLESLKKQPMTFIELQRSLNAKKSTLYMLVLALQRSGLVSRAEKNEPLKLSNEFADTVRKYAQWWDGWLEH